MALVNSHPDYLKQDPTWNVYREFLASMKEHGGFWNALPRDAAEWWKMRSTSDIEYWKINGKMAKVQLSEDTLDLGISVD